jgi:Tol biopolymer transport system component
MTDTQIRDRLRGLVDPLPIDLEGRLAVVRAAPPRRGPNRGLIAAIALALAAAAIAFVIWTFTAHNTVRPAARVANGRIVFVAHAPGYVPPAHTGFHGFADTDLYAMNPDGSSVMQVTSGPDADYLPAWSPDGTRVAFVRSANVFLVQGDGTRVRQLTFCRYTSCVDGVAWSPEGEWIAYLRGWDVYLVKPDGTENHLISHCGDCTYAGLSWSPDGSSIVLGTDGFPGERFGGLVVLRVGDPAAHGLRAVHPITFCEQRWALCHRSLIDADPSWSPDGRWIAFAHGSGLWLVRPDGTDEHQLAGCPKTLQKLVGTGLCPASHPVWAPDGTKIVFQGRDSIYVMNADGTGAVRIRRNGSLGSWQGVVSSSPQPAMEFRDALVFERIDPCGFGLCTEDRPPPVIVVANSDGSDARAIGRGTQPASSPDGTRIAFKGLDGDLYVMGANGTGVTRIFNCRGPDCHGIDRPTWSPDGSRLTFGGTFSRQGVWIKELYVIDVDGSNLERVTTCRRPACARQSLPAWSPDGRSIAFIGTNLRTADPRLYGRDLILLDLETGNLRTVYRCGRECSQQAGLAWSPTGRSIAFGLGSGLSVVDADGSDLRQLTNGQDVDPSWSSDGRWIVFTRYLPREADGISTIDVRDGHVSIVVPGSGRWSYLFPTWLAR